MDITRENYESWFVDYLEGKLDVKLVDRFIEFLQENPDLKEELKLFESVTAVPEDLSFKAKNKLYKSKYDQEAGFNEAAIAGMEGDLEAEERTDFEKYLAIHPDRQKELDLFEKTQLIADPNIRFAKKESLYKKPARKIVLLWAGRVAAVLVLALAIFSLFNLKSNLPASENPIAQAKEETVKIPEARDEIKQNQPVQENTVTQKTLDHEATPDIKNKLALSNKNKKLSTPIKEQAQPEVIEIQRIPLEVPESLHAIVASIDLSHPHADLGVMTLVEPRFLPDDEHLLTDNLREKVSLQKITRAGLNLVTSISNERFTYETSKDGKVVEYNYDSRLLAFSIPLNHTVDDK